MAAEDEDNGQEDVLALTGTAVLAAVSPEGDDGETAPALFGDGNGERRELAADGFPGRPAEGGEGSENGWAKAPMEAEDGFWAGETFRPRQAAEALGQAVRALEPVRAETAEAAAAGRIWDSGETVRGTADREAGAGHG